MNEFNTLMGKEVKKNTVTMSEKMGGLYSLDNPTRDSAAVQQAAGHDFSVCLEPIAIAETGLVIPGKASVVNCDTKRPLGNSVVGDTYKPCQPDELYGLADHLLSLDDDMMITDVLKSSNGGQMGLQINAGNWSPTGDFGDRLENNLILITSFDGTKATGLRTVSFRPICTNQYGLTHKMYSIRHTSKADQRLNELKVLLTQATRDIEKENEKIQNLVNKAMSKKAASKWFNDFLLNGKDESSLKGRGKTVHANNISDFERLLTQGAGCEAGEGTAYAAFNAITNYCTHERGSRVHSGNDEGEVRLESNLFGSGLKFAHSAFESLLKV